jgi:hypothetical protein
VTVWVVSALWHSGSRHSTSSWNVAPVGLGGTGAGVGDGGGSESADGVSAGDGVAGGVGIVAAGNADGAMVGPDVVMVIGLGAAGEPAGVGVAGVSAHAARRTPRRRDAARRFAFICRRRWCCGLSRR